MTKLEIEAFLMIVKCGSISVAADKLFVTQPALSHRIRAMEEELGYLLFERGRGVRNIRLTDQGEEFLQIAEKFLRLYAEAEDIPKKKRRPVLHVSTVNSLSAYLMPQVIKRLADGQEACSVIFKSGRSTDIYGYVENGEVDVALVTDPLHSNRAVTFPVFQEPFVFAGGEAWIGTGIISPDKLNPAEQIRMPWNLECDVWHKRWFSPDIQPGLTADRMEFLEEFLEGERWAIVPLLVAARLKRSNICICPLEHGPENLTIYGLTSDSQKNNQIRRFLQAVHEEVSKVEGIQSFYTGRI